MNTQRALSKLIGGIYDAGLAAQPWSDVLAELGRLMRSPQVNLVVTAEDRAVDSSGADPEFQRSYVEHYFACNVLADRAKVLSAGAVVSERGLLERSDYLRSEFYNDFVRPQGMDSALMGIVARARGREAVVSCWRPRASSDWDRRHGELLDLVIPHLNRALRLGYELRESRTELRSCAEALNATGLATIIVDPRGRASFVSRAAERVLGRQDGLTLRRGVLHAVSSSENAALKRLTRTALYPVDLASPRGGSLPISRPSGRKPLVFRVFPLCGDASAPGSAMVTLIDTDREPYVSRDVLRDVYGLTLAEAEVALRVLDGHGLQGVADSLGVTLSTVRTHLQRVFDKTGTHRQADLVRALLQLRQEPADETRTIKR